MKKAMSVGPDMTGGHGLCHLYFLRQAEFCASCFQADCILPLSLLQKCLIVLIVLHQQIRRVQPIRTFFHALPAVQAVLDLLHFPLPFFGEPSVLRRSTEHQTHPCTVVDLDPRRTWHTVTASPAEVARELFFICLDLLQ